MIRILALRARTPNTTYTLTSLGIRSKIVLIECYGHDETTKITVNRTTQGLKYTILKCLLQRISIILSQLLRTLDMFRGHEYV